ncbi:hypothetical protein GGF32_006850 [Allomyces javanicus]|nr:hypothetical protein GGF32_006850 [Allomyces javanicus]
MSATNLRPAQARALLNVTDLLTLSHLALNTPFDRVYRRMLTDMWPNFSPPKSVATMYEAIERVFAFRKAAFHEALAQVNPRPPMAVAFMGARIDNSACLTGEEGVKFVPPFMAATVHFFMPDWKLVAHTAEFALNNPDDGDIEYIVGRMIREYMPDPQALLCGVTAAANADSARAFCHRGRRRALVAATNGPIMDVWDRCWKAIYKRTDPKLAEDRFYPPTDEPGKWTWTRDMYQFAHKHRAVFLAVLRVASAEIPGNSRPTEEDWTVFTKVVEIFEMIDQSLVAIKASSYPTLSRAALHLMRVYATLKLRESQPDFPAPLRDGVARMLAKIRAVWPVVITRHVYHALYLDAVSCCKEGFVEFFGHYAAEIEGAPCSPDAIQARWKAIRDEILGDMVRAEQLEDLGLENEFRAKLNAELDTYETLVQEYQCSGGLWSPTASTVWWRDHGAQVPHVAHAARRVLCVPATMGTAMQAISPPWDDDHLDEQLMFWDVSSGVISFKLAPEMVVGRSLIETAEDMGIDVGAAHSVLTHLPPVTAVDEDYGDYLQRDVFDLEDVRLRWEEAMGREDQGDATLNPRFVLPKSVAAVALAVERVYAFRKAQFRAALAQMDPRPPIAVSFMAPRIDNSGYFVAETDDSVQPFVAVAVHFFTPDWKLVTHVAEFAEIDPVSPDDPDVEVAVWNVVREYMPDPSALLCGVTAAANADSAHVVRAMQGKLHDLAPGDTTLPVKLLLPSALVCNAAGDVYERHWTAVQRTNPSFNEEEFFAPLDEPGKWTMTRGMYLYVHMHRAVYLAVLADPVAHIPVNARPSEADWVVFARLMTIYVKLKDREAQPELPSPIRDGVVQMLSKIRSAWTLVMTRHVYHALYLDPATNGRLNAELDTYEALVRMHRARRAKWTPTASAEWWCTNGAWVPHVARAARRVLCVPVTTGSPMQAVSPSGTNSAQWEGNSGTLPVDSARAMVVGRSLFRTAEIMGIDEDKASEVLHHLPVAADGGATENECEVINLELVRERWEEVMSQQGDGTGWDVTGA